MKIRSLRVEQFKKFDQAVLVDGFAGGLNLLTGPNETGKSTLLLALRAALFERHGTKSDAVRSFAPHHVTGARPTVTLEFEIKGECLRLEKSFLKRPSARLERANGQRFEGMEAEAELRQVLGLDPKEKSPINKPSPAHFGVLLTPQATSFKQPDLADGTRHSLEAAIADDIAELGNQSEVDGLLAAFDGMMSDVVDKRGKPKNRYKEVVERLAGVERDIAEATEERAALDGQLVQLTQAIAERSGLVAAEDGDRLAEHLAALEAARTEAAHRQTLENHHLAAGQRLQEAEAKRAALQSRQDERQRLEAETETLQQAAGDQQSRWSTIEEALAQQEEELAEVREKQRQAERRRRDLEALAREADRLRQVETTLSALATDVRLDLETTALERVTLDGKPAPSPNERRQVTEGLSIEIEGIGRIGIEPKIEPMRETLAAKAEAERRIGDLLGTLELKEVEADAIDAAWQAVGAEIEALDSARSELDTTLADERRRIAEARAALDASNERRASLAERLSEIDAAAAMEATDQAALDAEIAEAGAAAVATERALDAAPKALTQDAASIDVEIAALRRQIDSRRNALESVNKRVAALESAVAVRSGLGLDEKIAQLDREHHLLRAERDAFALEHRALDLLQSTLRATADEAKATFNAPLSARLTPYLQGLFDGATPIVTPSFSIEKVERNGMEEPYLQLSDGTREQIAILARLAFADMLKDQDLPALIVLDDALAFSDDHRLMRMVEILEAAATRMQIIILSCREDRFTGIEATRLLIEPAPERVSSAA